MKNILETLEFNKIKQQLTSYTACSLGRECIETLSMYENKNELLYQLQLTDEAMRLINSYGRVPLGGLHDLSLICQKANMDGMLYPQQLLEVHSTLEAVHNILLYRETQELEVPLFDDLIKLLVEIKPLQQEIQRCIGYDGEINDHASSALYSIRKNIRHIEASIHTKMNQLASSQKEYLSEAIVTMRNDRFVLPVKTVSKGNVKGIVHGESSTSHTSYIEPESVVLMNNQLTEEKNKELQEIERILYELSQKVKEHTVILNANQEILKTLDFMFAKGAYGISIDGMIATIGEDNRHLSLKQARHPLIDKTKVIANDIEISTPYEMLLITGSNTGGKTVTLKTVGLLSLMSLSGLAIPVASATVPFYDQIFCDLGDDQSIEQSLSTFSSHMKKIVEITNNVTHHSLILIDEIGSGTDPREGECLAQSILDYLHGYHCHVVASTHYSGLKKYAQEKPYVLFASVEFDLETMSPTYHLLTGLIGQSYAFEISTRLGLNDHIVANARAIKEESMSQVDHLLESLETELENNRQLQVRLDDAIDYNHQLEKELKQELERIKHEKEKMLKAAKEEANQLVEKAKADVQVVLDDLKKQAKDVKMHVVIDARHQLEDMKYVDPQVKLVNNEKHEYIVGDRVKILSVNREGEVTAIGKNGQLTISLGGLKMQLQQNEVQYIGKALKPKIKANKKSLKKVSSGQYELNIIGMRYEEAMRIVDKFLDDALVNNYPHVRIIHGMGTGVLRNGVRKMLDKNKNVVSYRDGGPNEGGLGATLVYFE